MVARLKHAYDRARSIIGSARAECLEAAIAVDKLRKDQRPDQVHVVVLAESHVWTSREEIQSRVRLPGGKNTGFARFVYCLGYGEPLLVDPPVVPNLSTHQFWTLLHDTVRGPTASHFSLLKSGEPDLKTRVRNKLVLLAEMRRAGIWLMDASVTALYRQGSLVDSEDDYNAVLRACWKSYVGEIVCENKPSAILIIGRRVERAIGDAIRTDLRAVELVTINAPNARVKRGVRTDDRIACFDLCRRHRA